MNPSTEICDPVSIDSTKTKEELLQALTCLRQRLEVLKKTESRRKESSKDLRRLAAVVADSNDAITMQTLEGVITAWNRGAENIYGYSQQEALGMSIFKIVPDDEREATLDIMRRLADGEKIESWETQRTTKTGDVLDVWLTATILRDDSGNPCFIATTERDITYLKRAQAEQKDFIRKLEELNTFKSRILGITAHDLRNPLYVINAGVRFLLDSNLEGKLDPKQYSLLKNIFRSGNEMAELLNNLLDFSKIESGKMELHTGRHDFNSLVEQKVEASRMLAKGKNIKIQNFLEAIPAFDFDEIKMKQIIQNLLSNAIKFSPQGATIEVSTQRKGDWVTFSVRDQGPGISKSDQESLFAEFQTLSSTPTGGEKATGLGLSIVKSFVEMHGGRIDVVSEPGKGATFIFKIPLKQNF